MKKIVLVAVMVSIAFFSFCGKKETPQEKAQRELTNAFKQMGEALQQTGQPGQTAKITVVDKETLMAALPKLDGWQLNDPSFNRGAFGGIEIANLNARFSGGDKELEVKISDTGTAQAMLMPLKMALQMNVAHEDGNGYEKVSNYNDIPVIEKFTKGSQRSELTVVYKDRYIVELDSKGEGSMDLLKNALSRMDLTKLP